ncbi:MAG: DUF86 domain-containing protein [Chloroflexi bacterium]|nr:DUF86 domain-containing protein [Chloroflexota bacterium]MCY3936765.1 DUF86 domain-containing protein [Chloroflexota bacterium]
MCDCGDETRHWDLYVRDMIEFAENILSYTKGMDQEGFIAETRTYDATLRNIELIGEAATHVPHDIREAHPEIEWRRIVATRNRVAHGYLGIDDDVVWDVNQTDIPDLLFKLRDLLESREDDARQAE